MTQKPESQERPAANQADRHLDTANRCLVRQLRVLSRLGRHPPQLNWLASSSSPTDKRHRAGVSPGQDQNDSRRTLRPLRGRFLPLESFQRRQTPFESVCLSPGLRRRLSNRARSHEGLHRGLASVKGTREQSERDQHLLVVAAAVWPRRWPT